MQECYEIEDLKKFKDNKKFLDNLEKAINRNIQTKSNNLGLSYIYRNIIHGQENINKKWNYLQGAHTCYMYTSEKYNMNILLIGERHDVSLTKRDIKNHIDVKKFIETQISTATDYVDIFLEFVIQYRNFTESTMEFVKSTMPANNMFNVATEYFKSTTAFDKPYPYLRTHLIDTRAGEGDIIFDVLQAGLSNTDYQQIIDKVNIVLNILETKKSRVEYFIQLSHRFKIFKQLENIEDKELDNSIYKYFMDMISDDFLSLEYKSLEKTRFIKSEIIKQDFNNRINFNNFIYRLMVYCGVFMDMYTMSRLFRTYNVKDPNVYSGRARNAIIYTGSSHSTNYSNFLKHIGYFKEKYNYGYEIIEQIDDQVHTKVNISKLEQPVFINKKRIL